MWIVVNKDGHIRAYGRNDAACINPNAFILHALSMDSTLTVLFVDGTGKVTKYDRGEAYKYVTYSVQ